MVKTALDHGQSVIYSESALRQHQAYIDCNIIDIGTSVYTAQLAWAVKKRSHLYRTFGYQIKKLKEIGAVQRYYKMYDTTKQVCPDYSGNPLSVKQCITAFKFMSAGILFGLLWLVLEILAPRKWIKWFLKTGNRFFKNAQIQTRIRHFNADIFNFDQRRRNSY